MTEPKKSLARRPIPGELLPPIEESPAPPAPVQPHVVFVQSPQQAAPIVHSHVGVYVAPQETNGFGTAGFVVSLLSFFLCGLTSPLGLMMSLIALAWRPRGMAAAGTLLGLLGSWWLFAGGLVMMLGIIGVAASPSIPPPPAAPAKVVSGIADRPAQRRTVEVPDAPPLSFVPAEDKPAEQTIYRGDPAPIRPVDPTPEPKPTKPPAEMRTWKAASGGFKTEATFLSMGAGKVKLRKADGVEITVPLDQLSSDDQSWIQEFGRSRR